MRSRCANASELRGKVAFIPIVTAPLGESYRDGKRQDSAKKARTLSSRYCDMHSVQ